MNRRQEMFDTMGLIYLLEASHFASYLGSTIRYNLEGTRFITNYAMNKGDEYPRQLSTSIDQLDFNVCHLQTLKEYLDIRIQQYHRKPTETERKRISLIVNIFNARANAFRYDRRWYDKKIICL